MKLEDFHPCPECRNMLLCCDIAKCSRDYHTPYPLHIPPGPTPEQVGDALAKLIATARKNTKNQK